MTPIARLCDVFASQVDAQRCFPGYFSGLRAHLCMSKNDPFPESIIGPEIIIYYCEHCTFCRPAATRIGIVLLCASYQGRFEARKKLYDYLSFDESVELPRMMVPDSVKEIDIDELDSMVVKYHKSHKEDENVFRI